MPSCEKKAAVHAGTEPTLGSGALPRSDSEIWSSFLALNAQSPCIPLAPALTQEYVACIFAFCWELAHNKLNKLVISKNKTNIWGTFSTGTFPRAPLCSPLVGRSSYMQPASQLPKASFGNLGSHNTPIFLIFTFQILSKFTCPVFNPLLLEESCLISDNSLTLGDRRFSSGYNIFI